MSKIIAFDKYKRRLGADLGAELVTHLGANLTSASLRAKQAVRHGAAATDRQAHIADILVSVVVPTCNRPDLLRQCLSSLLQQRFNFARHEIIVVDDAPSRATHDVVVALSGKAARAPAIVYIATHGPHGPAAARHRGWRAARGFFFAFSVVVSFVKPDRL